MSDNQKELIDLVVKNLTVLRRDNGPTYWLMLIGIGSVVSGISALLLKPTGINLFLIISFIVWVNTFIPLWHARRAKERLAEEKARKAAAKVAPKV